MEKINLPAHMRDAYTEAINDFAKDGFRYTSNVVFENENVFTIEVDATDSQLVSLGIKIGYKLPLRMNNGQKSLVRKCIELAKKNAVDTETMDRLENLLRTISKM